MADRFIVINPEGLKLPSSDPMRVDGGQNDFVGLFDDTTSQSGRVKFRNPDDYIGTPVLILQFDPNDTQTGTLTVKWDISVMKVTPNTGVNRKVDNFDTANTGTKTLDLNQGTGELVELSISLTNFASAVAGDQLTFQIALNVSGTATGDTELSTITYKYSNT